MPIDVRGRIPAGYRNKASDQTFSNYVDFYTGQAQGFHPEVIVQAARDQEALGFDSSLFPQYGTGAAVWPVVGWALAATTRLKLVAAHRIGLQLPTTAARVLATLDRLSNGRIYAHLLQGQGDEDLQRDGLFLPKDERYRRAHEYLDIFIRELTASEPFDYQGEHYQVSNARSDVLPVQKPYPQLSIPGTSAAGLELAAKYADVHSIPIATLDSARQAIARVEPLATRLGRSLRYWGDSNIILAESDAQAWDLARRIGDEVEQIKRQAGLLRQNHADSVSAIDRGAVSAHEGSVWYPRLNLLTGHGYSLVGSPETLAGHFLELYKLGVSVITLGGIIGNYASAGLSLDTAEQQQLVRELIERLHQGADAIDRDNTTAHSHTLKQLA